MNDQDLKFDVKKDLVIKYIKLLEELGYKATTVLAGPDPLYSFRAVLKTVKNNREVQIFYMVFFGSEVSLTEFKDKYIEGTVDSRRIFVEKVEKLIMWYTVEEILCALLSDDYDRRISDVYINGKVVIPKSQLGRIFELFNFKGGNLSHQVRTRVKKNR